MTQRMAPGAEPRPGGAQPPPGARPSDDAEDGAWGGAPSGRRTASAGRMAFG